jgi:eukaryotic-like serine/threonine-protein kinase
MQAEALKEICGDEQEFGRYRLLCRIASGGMANLYLARFLRDTTFGKIIAIKRIHEHLAHDDTFCAMLVDEARLCARLCHPNVVQVMELGSAKGTMYIAMEYVEGESLKALLRRAQPSYAHCARIAARVAAGLHHAHELCDAEGQPLGVVHRDVSPQNILISYEGEVKLVDFGVVKAKNNLQQTGQKVIKGKFAYMAPEQISAGAVDRRTDVFALGVVLYEITTGRRLFRANTPLESVAKVQQMKIPSPSRLVPGYPRQLEEIVMTALQRDPVQRFQSAGELEDALQELVQEANSIAAPTQRATVRNLGWVMKRVFADRIAKKQRMLARSEKTGSIVIDPTRVSGATPSLSLGGTVSAAAAWLERAGAARLQFWSLLVLGCAVGVLLVALLLALGVW